MRETEREKESNLGPHGRRFYGGELGLKEKFTRRKGGDGREKKVGRLDTLWFHPAPEVPPR